MAVPSISMSSLLPSSSVVLLVDLYGGGWGPIKYYAPKLFLTCLRRRTPISVIIVHSSSPTIRHLLHYISKALKSESSHSSFPGHTFKPQPRI